MRVLHVIPSLSPRHGGPTTAAIEMVRTLNARGVEAEISTTDEDIPAASVAAPFLHEGAPVRVFPRCPARLPLLKNYKGSPAFAAWLRANIHAYDLLHVHALFSHLPTVAMRIARQAGIPYINRPLGLLGRWPLRQSALRKRLYLRLVERSNLVNAAALHFVSDDEQSEADALDLATPSFVVPHGVAVPKLVPDAPRRLREETHIPAERRIVLFLGRLHAKKGLDLLLRGLALWPQPRPILLIAGDGPERPRLEELVRELSLGLDIRWLGFVTGERRQLCLQGADLFALTSHHENLGLAVLEALAAGTPVLVSPQVALAGAIKSAGLGVVTSLEPAAICDGLARGLTYLKTGPDCATRRAFVEAEHSWPAIAQTLAEKYARLVKNVGAIAARSR